MRAASRVIGTVLMMATATATASAYQGGEVKNGGIVVGEVSYGGSPRPPRNLPVTKDDEVCGHTQSAEDEVVSAAGKVANAVVSIVGITRGKPFGATPAVLDQRGCRYVPHVLLVRPGETIVVRNSDGVLHNIHTESRTNPPLNIAQPAFKKEVGIQLELPEAVGVKCDVHEWMSGVIVVMDTPYYATTDERGSFRLADVPPGEYTLRVWHEKLGEKSVKVKIEPGRESRAGIAFAAK